jgi:hypothetical protein
MSVTHRNRASLPKPPVENADGSLISIRTLTLVSIASGLTALVAWHPTLAVPIGVGVAALTLLNKVVSR